MQFPHDNTLYADPYSAETQACADCSREVDEDATYYGLFGEIYCPACAAYYRRNTME